MQEGGREREGVHLYKLIISIAVSFTSSQMGVTKKHYMLLSKASPIRKALIRIFLIVHKEDENVNK